MRALLGMVLFSMVGCDTLWGGYVGNTDLAVSADGGITCSVSGGCDLASGDLATGDLAQGPPPDFSTLGCSSNSACSMPTPFCDLNTNMCVMSLPPDEGFLPSTIPAVAFDFPYTIMATGDFNGDKITDVAVSGLFIGATPSATDAKTTNVFIYLGDGKGGLTADGSCAMAAADRPVYLLTVPGPGTADELLVAMFNPKVVHCVRNGGNWNISTAGTGGMFDGFKQLALAHDMGVVFPDLVIRTSAQLFPDTMGTGRLRVHRSGANYVFSDPNPTQASSSDISWVTTAPYHFGATGVPANSADTLALSWDTAIHPAINFQYVDGNDVFQDQGSAQSPMVGGSPFTELNGRPFRTSALFKATSQTPPFLLNIVSQSENWLSLQYGMTVPGFAVTSPVKATPNGIMLPYTGDANGDKQDEVGIYTMGVGTTDARRLQLLSTKGNTINVSKPIVDVTAGSSENFRGMALGLLGDQNDLRSSIGRKDLIMLIENPTTMKSRLMVRRANLNYVY